MPNMKQRKIISNNFTGSNIERPKYWTNLKIDFRGTNFIFANYMQKIFEQSVIKIRQKSLKSIWISGREYNRALDYSKLLTIKKELHFCLLK